MKISIATKGKMLKAVGIIIIAPYVIVKALMVIVIILGPLMIVATLIVIGCVSIAIQWLRNIVALFWLLFTYRIKRWWLY